MSGLLSRKTVLLAKIESSYGVDPTPTAASNAIEIFELTGPKFNSSPVERKPLRNSLSPKPIKRSLKTTEVQFTTELKNGGTAGTAGRLSPLFRACGMSENIVAGSSVAYLPTSTFESCTLYVYRDGLLWKILGAVGTFEIVVEAGKIPLVKWTFRGKYTIAEDAALVTGTYESTEGVVAESTSTQISGFAGVVRSFSVDIANQLTDRPSLNAAGAMQAVRISDRTPSGKMTLEAELRATEDIIGEWDAGTMVNFTSTIGTSAGQIVQIKSTSNVQYDEIPPGDDNGILMFDAGLRFSGTDNEIEIILK